MKRLLLLSCSATKRSDPGMLPAIERYDGPAYRVLRAWRDDGHRLPRILILSAQYGLIGRDHPIADYDRVMDEARAEMLKGTNVLRREIHTACWAADDIFVFGGTLYQDVFRAWLPTHAKNDPATPIELPVQWSRGPIGMQLHQLAAWLKSPRHPGARPGDAERRV